MSDVESDENGRLGSVMGATVISSIGFALMSFTGVKTVLEFQRELVEAVTDVVNLRPVEAFYHIAGFQAHWVFWYGLAISALPFAVLYGSIYWRALTDSMPEADDRYVDEWERENL